MDGFPADIPSTGTIQIGCFMLTNNVKRWIVEKKMMFCPGSKINLWCRAQVKKENDENWSILKMKYAIFQQLREKHPKWMHQSMSVG